VLIDYTFLPLISFVFDSASVTYISSGSFLPSFILDGRQADKHENKHDLYITLFPIFSSKVRNIFVIVDQNLAYFYNCVLNINDNYKTLNILYLSFEKIIILACNGILCLVGKTCIPANILACERPSRSSAS